MSQRFAQVPVFFHLPNDPPAINYAEVVDRDIVDKSKSR